MRRAITLMTCTCPTQGCVPSQCDCARLRGKPGDPGDIFRDLGWPLDTVAWGPELPDREHYL